MKPYVIDSISELHRLLQLPPPHHPLISIFRFEDITCYDDEKLEAVAYNFYCVALKKNFTEPMKYGQHYYDFDEGTMTFFAPKQVVITEIRDDWELEGFWLVFHPDFIQGYSFATEIQNYDYFSYKINEALHVSSQEEMTLNRILEDIKQEYTRPGDQFSQDVMIKQLELLLQYCNRYYHRQFLTRNQADSGLLVRFEQLLDGYFEKEPSSQWDTSDVQYFAKQLHVSPNYLSDMLRSITGQSTQQHIQQKRLEKAKELLSTTSLDITQIAYMVGYEYSQSFNKFFKKNTDLSPLAFRNQLNKN
jgi:AraC-like DNA-binding protein